MPKANAKQTANNKTKAPAPIKVPAQVKAELAACFKGDAAVLSIQESQAQNWLKLGKTLHSVSDGNEDTARRYLKQAFVDADRGTVELNKDGDDWKFSFELNESSYISKIMKLGFPDDEQNLEKAEKANLPTNKLLAAARGTLVPKKGAKDLSDPKNWIAKPNSGSGGGSGGHNKKAPIDAFSLAQANAFTAAQTAKLKIEQVANKVAEAAKAAGYDLDELGSLIKND